MSPPVPPLSSVDAAACVGIGWRQPHYRALPAQRPALGFIEVHSENYFAEGGAALQVLERGRALWDVSLHGVGLALGSMAGIDPWHLEQLARLVGRIDPVRVSDHASFGRAPLRPGGPVVHANDLLPLAFTEATLSRTVRHVQQVQERLRRPLLVENLSAYLHWAGAEMDEIEFLHRLAARSGCRLLLDVNNLVVNARNARRSDPLAHVCAQIDRLPAGIVGEIHLAGHADLGDIVIDDHGSRVGALAWQAFAHAIARLGPVPTLIEWDTDLPALDVLLGEAAQAAAVIAKVTAGATGPAPARSFAVADAIADASVERRDPARQSLLLAALWPRAAIAGAEAEPGAAPVAPAAPALPAALAAELDATAGPAPLRGLQAYRLNAGAAAERGLAAVFPVVQALVGDEAFAGLARSYWQASPPARGDLAWAGESLPRFVADDPALAELPYLADVARLEWLIARAEGAADARGSGADRDASLQRLADTEPSALTLRLPAGTALCASRWPIVRLWQAHPPAPGGAVRSLDDAALPALREALAGRHAETAFVWRTGLAVQVAAVDRGDAACLAALIAGASLAEALARAFAADAGWSFDDWFARALRAGWIVDCAPLPAADPARGRMRQPAPADG